MGQYKFIQYTVSNRVATIALNSPKSLNALHQQMRLELMHVISVVEADNDVRIIVLTGAGRGFCAGADLSEGMPGFDTFVDQCAAEYEPWLMAIYNSSKLYVAAVNGAAAGIGAAMVMNCDLVVMAEGAYLYQAFSAIGLMPDGGATWQLVQKIGYHRAMDLAVNAGKLTADQCLELGIANRVVASDSLIEEAQQWAELMANGAPLAQTAIKKLMRNSTNSSYQQAIVHEAEEQSALIQSEDSRNAVAAFFKKQAPKFLGK